MVKAYLRYVHKSTVGVVASTGANVVFDHEGKLAVTPGNDDVLVWDIKQAKLSQRWHDADNTSEVTCIARSPMDYIFAVGFADGAIRIWNMQSGTSTVTFTGHRGAVMALQFDLHGARLASGGKDTDIVIWDVVGEHGVTRLRGHKDQITALHFISTTLLEGGSTQTDATHILSASKDTLIKAWDLATSHCVETLVSHRSEVWSLAVTQQLPSLANSNGVDNENDAQKGETTAIQGNSRKLTVVSGGSDPELRVWTLDLTTLDKLLEQPKENNDNANNELYKRAFTLHGVLPRQSNERIVTMQFHPFGRYFAVQAADKHVELYRIRSLEEIHKKLQRRKKRLREKQLPETDVKTLSKTEQPSDVPSISISDEITSFAIVRTLSKVRSFDFAPLSLGKLGEAAFVITLSNNTIERYQFQMASKAGDTPPAKTNCIELPGHRGDVRAVALSSDDELLASVGTGMVKVWNTLTGQCIRSMECGYALCCVFVPGNRHLLVGTKAGDIEIFSLASSTLLSSIKAHEGAVWSIHVRPDKRGFISGSANKDVKFWDFAMVKVPVEENSIETGKSQPERTQLGAIHVRTLRMSDEVLCVRYTPNQQLIAVSLLDATVKVFYSDTLKFFLSLYGHKLPVLTIDISSDNMLIATGSADKNVKLWGLDFGDCHKSIFAHQDSIMAIQFVWGTHYFFTASKDKTVKYWDGDKFEQIMKLTGHQGEVWALAIAKHGNFIVSASHDRSIRFWDKTDEQLFLEEEREHELDELADDSITQQIAQDHSGAAERPTTESLKSGERILEALDIAESERAQWNEYEKHKHTGVAPPPKHGLLIAMGNLSVEDYLMHITRQVRSSELESALLTIPFSKIVTLMHYLNVWAEKEQNGPLICRVLFFILTIHHDQIVSNRVMRPTLAALQSNVYAMLQREKDTIGYNLAALSHLKREQQMQNATEYYEDDVRR